MKKKKQLNKILELRQEVENEFSKKDGFMSKVKKLDREIDNFLGQCGHYDPDDKKFGRLLHHLHESDEYMLDNMDCFEESLKNIHDPVVMLLEKEK